MILRQGTDHGDPCYHLWAFPEGSKGFHTTVLVPNESRDGRASLLRRARAALRQEIARHSEFSVVDECLKASGLDGSAA